MVLSDQEIAEAIDKGEIKFDPPISPDQIQPSAVDLRLGYEFTTFDDDPGAYGYDITVHLGPHLDVERGVEKFGKTEHLQRGQAFTLEKGKFVLAYTLESVELSNTIAARVEGRSTLGRLGISIHQTAPTVHPNFSGRLRLEISHNGPFNCTLPPEYRICQLIFERLGRPAGSPSPSRYQNQ